jgi:hypothetical protein
MACSRCGKKSSDKLTPVSSQTASGERPRPALRQRAVGQSARTTRFGQPIQRAQQPQPPAEG